MRVKDVEGFGYITVIKDAAGLPYDFEDRLKGPEPPTPQWAPVLIAVIVIVALVGTAGAVAAF